MSRKNILITNDDGVCGAGLQVLCDYFSKDHNVYVICPDSNRSAVSSQINLSKKLEFVNFGENKFTCSGSPVDCVIAAFKSSLFNGVKFDAVLSGINGGANLGTDDVYSGTVAAARQACLYGCPGIALSLFSAEDNYNYGPLAEFALKNFDSLIYLCSDELFVSVNANSIQGDSYEKAAMATLCVRDYRDTVIVNEENGRLYGTFVGGKIHSTGDERCDFKIVSAGGISVSRLFAEPVCEKSEIAIEWEL